MAEIDPTGVEQEVQEHEGLTEANGHRSIGVTKLRKEDARLITGQTNWTDNFQFPGMLYMAVVRSPMAHGRINNVDVSAALEQPGVVAAYSAADLGDANSALPCAWPVTEDIKMVTHTALATDKVRYVGDGVAVVIARDRYQAADAVEHVVVDYDPLPAVVDLEEALQGSTLVHDEAPNNTCYRFEMPVGDLDAAFDGADVVVERRFYQNRLIPNAIEPRAVVAVPASAAGEVTLYSATQIPHVNRVLLSMITGTPEHKLRVVAPDVGGGFGSKLDLYAEEALAIQIAKKLGRPIKWTESRSEGYQATIHGREMIQDIKIAADSDGRIRGLHVDLTADMGAYLQLVTPGIPLLGAFMYNAIYKMDAYSFNTTGVFTNKTPTDAYRGAGRPEATYAVERIMDELAAELGMDPLELRRRNWIKHEEFPFATVSGLTYDSGNYEAATDKAVQLFGYDELRAEQRKRRESGDRVQLGIGISTYTEMCGIAPSRVLGSLRYGAGGWETASIRVTPTGKVEVVTGTSPHGQGHETAWSQIAADALGVDFDDVDVIHGDTASAPQGYDTYGSRSLVIGGIAVHLAAEKVREKAKKFAAHMLEADEGDIEWANGKFSVRGSPETGKTIPEIALAVFAAHDYPEGLEPNLTADFTLDPENFSFPHGTHLAAMEVDTETGESKIRTYVCVDDVGKVINPQIVEGQVHGGLAQGIAQALFEEAVYDVDGNLVTSTLVDYYVPGAPDLPDYVTDRTETPATSNPLGVKGVGEAGTIASTPAIINGIVDAIRHLGVNDIRMPASPERVWRAIQDARGGGHADTAAASPTDVGGQQ
jgi:carbon-monoxide dehydrogenase large subunit